MHFFLPVLFCILLIDSVTKFAAKYFLPENSFSLIDNFLSFTLAFNKGVAFSFPIPYWAQMVLSVVFLCGIFYWARKYFYELSSYTQWGITLLISGALGNFWERVVFQKVTDFISFSTPWFSFPIFNIADIAIFLGIVLWFWGARYDEV